MAMPVSLEEISDNLLPRRYQEEIFVRAQQGNVIAALDTGSGKTFISTLLIKWISAQETPEHKITVFLVPKVALVQQQGEFITKQTSLRVRMFSGATAHDMSDRGGWAHDFETADVLVMTAQIFLNLLTHSHWSLSKVRLLVFDECHHTRKNHAYNGIMREYFQTTECHRPKVFGMTASPIWNPRNAPESLATLEKNLDSKVIAVKEHVDELIGHSPRPEEIIKTYRQAPQVYPDYQKQSLWQRLGLKNIPPEVGIPTEKILTRYEVTHNSLGPFGAELFLYTEVKQRVTQLIQERIESAMEVLTADQYSSVARGDLASIPNTVPPSLRELQNILAEFSADFDEPPDGVLPSEIPLSWCSPKLKVLAEELFLRHTPTFQGIVFVEQRHIATCLASVLRRIPFLVHTIKCEPLVGHGSGAGAGAKSHLKGMATRNQRDTVQLFRQRQLNLLIATSVAEEGLDFPACDLVIRFDPVQHMVGYLQSRGRARHRSSTFIIMVQEGSQAQAERYMEFFHSEPQLKKVYQQRHLAPAVEVEEDEDENDAPDPHDVAERERYVVPSTGAILTYITAISLLNHLCSLIPRDRFTSMHVPRYTGDFVSTVTLPSPLPLPAHLLVYQGPPKRSKKEARRAAAFLAVKSLHALNVFDDYLLPAKSTSVPQDEDADGVPIKNVQSVPDMLNVRVRDPWVMGSVIWLHVIRLDGIASAGLITGTTLPPTDLVVNNLFVSIDEPIEVVLDPRHAWSQRRAMEDYTRMGLWWCITGRGVTLPLTCYLVPITRDCRVDFYAIELAIAFPFGSYNWADVTEEQYGRVIYMNNRELGHPLLLQKMRPDVTPSSTPPPGSREAGFSTYRDYWLYKFTRKGHPPNISLDGICVEGIVLNRNSSCAYSLANEMVPCSNSKGAGSTTILPIELCRWALMPRHMYQAFYILPELCHRVTDVWRVQEIRSALRLPPIVDDLLIQAITLPSANAGFNNQRLETFGDAVLKLCAVVYLYNKYPHRHEGQLDGLKRTSIANRTLLARALEHGLEGYLSPETQSLRMWRYVATEEEAIFAARPRRCALRHYPRRSLQDCMEAILGASFATGGIDMALRTGTALGLSFGGPTPWCMRYSGRLKEAEVAPLFSGLEETLGYKFKHGQLLLEAITHPSFRSSNCSSYQRLEFLGDAFIDMVVTEYLYNKFPYATSGQLSWARSRAVCGPALASIAVRRLGLHKLLLINNVELSMAINKHVPVLEEITDEEIILHGWKHDPPKALSDVLESVLGALMVDCDYNYDKAAAVAELVLQDLLAALTPDLPKDPVTELMVWVAQSGCRCTSFVKGQSRPEVRRYDCMSVLVHDTIVAGPLAAPNISMAKGLAAERARQVLADPESPNFLSRICTCPAKKGKAAKKLPTPLPIDVPDKKELSDETNEGFAMLAQILVEEIKEQVAVAEEEGEGDDDHADAEDEDLIEELEVEQMMEV